MTFGKWNSFPVSGVEDNSAYKFEASTVHPLMLAPIISYTWAAHFDESLHPPLIQVLSKGPPI